MTIHVIAISSKFQFRSNSVSLARGSPVTISGLNFDPVVRLRWELGQIQSLIIPKRQRDNRFVFERRNIESFIYFKIASLQLHFGSIFNQTWRMA
jgi:hypothetical protein